MRCREWQGARSKAGYGQRWRDGKVRYVHREVWEMVEGPLLPGEEVLHRCDNPPCFLFEHLFKGTQLDNVRDCIAKGRTRHPAKLTIEQRAEIVRRWLAGEKPKDIAPDFGISKNYVIRVVRPMVGADLTSARRGQGRWS